MVPDSLQVPPVFVYGHPSLRGIAKAVPMDYPYLVLKEHADTLFRVLVNIHNLSPPHNFADGIAAPQIGLGLRMFILDRNYCPPGYQGPTDYGVFINPYLTGLSGTFSVNNDGCLSIPGYDTGGPSINRYASFTLHYDTLTNGALVTALPIVHSLQDKFSSLVQHEIDHLDGKFFIDQLWPAVPNTAVLNAIKSGNYPAGYAGYPTLPSPKS